MNAADIKEIVSTVFEGMIGLVALVGSGLMMNSHPDSTAIVGIGAAISTGVVTFYFGQRGTTKAVNGNITALSNIAAGLISTKAAATTSATAPQAGG